LVVVLVWHTEVTRAPMMDHAMRRSSIQAFAGQHLSALALAIVGALG